MLCDSGAAINFPVVGMTGGRRCGQALGRLTGRRVGLYSLGRDVSCRRHSIIVEHVLIPT